jgi:peptide/nickel transport system permease protein
VHSTWATSFFGSNSVLGCWATRCPATIELTIAAMTVAVVWASSPAWSPRCARTPGSTPHPDRGTVSFSLPWFALGVLAIVIFGVQLRWLPTIGRLPSQLDYHPTTNFVLLDAILQNRPELVGPWLQHLILPATTLALSMAGYITRIVRASVLEVLGDDFVRTARMKGLTERGSCAGTCCATPRCRS